MERSTSGIVVPGVGMGKRCKGRVEERLEGRVQTRHILGPFWNRRELERNSAEEERPTRVVLMHEPFIYLHSHHLVLYHLTQHCHLSNRHLFFYYFG